MEAASNVEAHTSLILPTATYVLRNFFAKIDACAPIPLCGERERDDIALRHLRYSQPG